MNLIVSTSYFGSIQYYSKLFPAPKIWIEAFEHYPKQTLRNRCIIYSANGPLTLSVPVTKGNVIKAYTKDICIDYSMAWQKNHFRAIESAYRCSPFYEFYIDEFLPFFSKSYKYLIDLNTEILSCIFKIFGLNADIAFSDTFHKLLPGDWIDCRYNLVSKGHRAGFDNSFEAPVYRQVFEPKAGFVENLSVLDLLFNTGPDAPDYIRHSVKP